MNKTQACAVFLIVQTILYSNNPTLTLFICFCINLLAFSIAAWREK